MATLAELLVKIGIDETGIDRAAERVERGFSGIGDRATRMGDRVISAGDRMSRMGGRLTLGLTTPLLFGFAKAEQAATDLGEAQNATSVVFGDAERKITQFAKTSQTSVGLSERAFREGVTPLGSLLTNFGFSQDAAADSSIRLAQRAADMASVFNTDVGDALGAIEAGLRGETEPLRRFGVSLDDASIKAKAVALGLADNTSEVDKNAKALAAEALILEQSEQVAGDFGNTIDSNANQQKVMAARAEDAAAAFGENLQPAKAKVLEVAGKLLDRFDQLSPGMQQNIVKAGLLAAALGPVLKVTGTLTKGLGGIIKVTGKTASGLSRLVGGFASAETAASKSSGVLGTVGGKLRTLPGAIGRAAAAFGRLALAAGRAAVQVLAAGLRMAAQAAAATARVVAAIALQIARWVVLGVQAMAQAIRVAAAWLISMGPIALVIAAVVGLVALIIANFDTIRNAISSAWRAVRDTTVSIWGSVVSFFGSIPGRIMAVIRGLKGMVSGFIKSVVVGIKTAAVQKWGVVVSWFSGIPGKITDAIGDLSSLLFDAGKAVINGLLDGIKDAFGAVKDFVGGIASDIASLKGPLPKDKVLLAPHGRAIIKGLGVGLDDEMDRLERQVVAAAERITRAASVDPLSVNDIRTPRVPGVGRVGGGGTTVVNVNVAGSIRSDKDLVALIRDELNFGGLRGAIRR